MSAQIIQTLRERYKDLHFLPSDTYYWSPSDRTVYYKKADRSESGVWSLLHEVGHGILGHTKYYSDFELVRMEMEAWEKAKEIAAGLNDERRTTNDELVASSVLNSQFSIIINEDHIQDCLDSYRDWLHKRSLCPDCRLSSIQTDAQTYTCVFCHKKWHVTAERFCRPYRKTLSTRLPNAKV